MRDLEIEVVQVGNNLRSMEISEVRASEQEEEFSTRLGEMSKRYQEVFFAFF